MITVEIKGTEQAGNKVRAGLFQNLTVRHDGTGQIGQISFAKERQWQLTQPFCESQDGGYRFLYRS